MAFLADDNNNNNKERVGFGSCNKIRPSSSTTKKRKMWQRPALAILYLSIVVVVTWLMEMGLWWDAGFATYQIVNPLRNLSVSQLQALLAMRGIHPTALLEKSEIVSLLQQSGPVQYGEILEDSPEIKPKRPVELVGKSQYYEQVYEETESMWLIEVVPGEGQYVGHHLVDDRTWHVLAPKLQMLQINSAIVSCQFDRRFCARQGWSHPQLVLVLPERESNEAFAQREANDDSHGSWSNGHKGSREHVVLASGTHLSATAVLSWLQKQIISRSQIVPDVNELEERWLNTTEVTSKQVPRVVFISEMLAPPLLIATLGLRLSARIKFSSYTVKKEETEQVSNMLKKYGLTGVPSLAVTTSKGVTSYGSQKGESLTSTALDSYMCSLRPHMNDAFLVSLVLANILAVADIFNAFDVRVTAWKHIIRTLIRMLVYNIFVFVLWLAFTAVLKFPSAGNFLESGSSFLSSFTSSWMFAELRYHWLMVGRHPVIFWMSAHIFGVIVVFYRAIMRTDNEPVDTDSSWWSIFSMDSFLVDVLFRPMASLSLPRPSQDLDLEEGMELLIERLATPDLWLHPVIPNDYMKDLPMWRYDGWGNEDDLKSESETDIDSVSENENETLLDLHACCQDEHCRLCDLWTTVKEIYVCHRCAILKRKLERQYMRYRKINIVNHHINVYEKLLKVYETCLKTKKTGNFAADKDKLGKQAGTSGWLPSPQRLNELKWTAPPYAIESRLCAICLGRYKWSAVLCGLPCGHNYHHSCITEWLLKDHHHCPTCRWPSYKAKSHNVPSHEHEE